MKPIDRQIHRLSEEISLGQRKEFREKANVIGSGLGPKYVDGERTDEIALCILVESKEPEHRLGDDDILPEEIVTDSGRAVTVDVEEVSGGFQATGVADPGSASPSRTERIRPMPGGVSISRATGNGGSSSALMWFEGDPVILTARHVATMNAEETVGDSIHRVRCSANLDAGDD